MKLQARIDLLSELGKHLLSEDENWLECKIKVQIHNSWFTKDFIQLSVQNIVTSFLQKELLENWTKNIPEQNLQPKTVGVVMAGNIPLVGFHDFLSVFISGNKIKIKASAKDELLINYIAKWLQISNAETKDLIEFQEMLKNCDAYIATGSNNSSRYFEYYFGKYPNIIRKNKTSVAILDGQEKPQELEALADDIHLYFGLGCRNVTKIFVPENYDFIPLLAAFNKYKYFEDHHKFKNNYDYNLAIHILNNKYYMTNGAILLVENESIFSPVSQLHYEYYSEKKSLLKKLKTTADLQCIVGKDFLPFGKAQSPSLSDYADGVDTLAFLSTI